MEQEAFQFNQERTVGEVIQGTFTFISQEFRGLFKLLLKYAVPIFILSSITQYMVLNNTMEAAQDPMGSFSGLFSGWYFINLIVNIAGHVVTISIIFAYIYQYIKNDPQIFMPRFKDLIPNYLAAGIVTGILGMIGFFLLIIPGIYLAIVFTMIAPIIAFRGMRLSQALSESFSFIKGFWWPTFGLMILLAILVIIISLALSIPLMLAGMYTFFTPMLFENGSIPVFYTVWNTIVNILMSLIYVVFYIAIAVQFFSIQERKHAPTLSDKIDQITNG